MSDLERTTKKLCHSSESPLLDTEDCAVCLQPKNHPAELPCGHIFCFLCLKGIAFRNQRCALCRQDIPVDYLNNPVFVDPLESAVREQSENEPMQWFYRGRNGWWKYDERSNEDLEEKWQSGATRCQLQLAGAVYNIDFTNMIQYQHNNMFRRRKIKRDLATTPIKGIAGIKILNPQELSTNAGPSILAAASNEEAVLDLNDAFRLLFLESPLQPAQDSTIENDDQFDNR